MGIIGKSRLHSILPLYLPWLLSVATQQDPPLSYWLAWLGSIFIFYETIVSPRGNADLDHLKGPRVMRPIMLVQIVFATFMCLSSVFYCLDHSGPGVSAEGSLEGEQGDLVLIAECQRLSLLAHASLVTGMLLLIPRRPSHKAFRLARNVNIDLFLVVGAFVAYTFGHAVKLFPPLAQMSVGLINTAVTMGVFLLLKGLTSGRIMIAVFGGALFAVDLIDASLSGYKEEVIVSVLILGFMTYHRFPRLTLFLGIPAFCLLLYLLPAYVQVIREEAWSGDITKFEARADAMDVLLEDSTGSQIRIASRVFLRDRASEIGMFTQFVRSTPKEIPFYGSEILKNCLVALIPRFLWPGKPLTEDLAMERVYAAGVVDRDSTVSAKTRPVVDGYLSAGTWGVFISMLIYGLVCQCIGNQLEAWFGGYELGTCIFFNGMFQPLWRGNSFEFLTNSVFWALVVVFLVFKILAAFRVLVQSPSNETDSSYCFL